MNERERFVVFEGISKRFKNLLALDNISFNVKKGEIFGYIGPNGAGKTTTIKIMVGLLRPTQGTLHVGGHLIPNEGTKFRLYLCCRTFWAYQTQSHSQLSWQLDLLHLTSNSCLSFQQKAVPTISKRLMKRLKTVKTTLLRKSFPVTPIYLYSKELGIYIMLR